MATYIWFAEYLLAQSKHVQIQLWEQWNVQQHHNPQEIVVGKGEVRGVWKFNAPNFILLCITLSPPQAQQFTSYSGWVEDDECGITERERNIDFDN